MNCKTKLDYLIDGQFFSILSNISKVHLGEDIILSQKFNDLVENCDWKNEGFVLKKLFTEHQMREIRGSIEVIIKTILEKNFISIEGFQLEHYHKFVDDKIHGEVITHTRRLYPSDFGVDVYQIVEQLSGIMGTELSFFNPIAKQNQWIICRINRPHSYDYNPVHKDIYESYDQFEQIPQMINCWIPVCGVTDRTGLPIAPGSHLVSEKAVVRTKAGSEMNGFNYSVNSIIEWDGSNALTTISPNDGEALVFSSHLIHGLARNMNEDKTRISFEFRLYKS